MATHRALAAVSRAVLRLLEDAVPRGEFPNAQFELQQALDLQKGPLGEGISLLLYRVAVNGARRNAPPRVEPDGRRFRPPLPVDLHYALCAWGRSADMQQRLFGFAVRAIEDTPILPPALLNQYGPDPAFRSHEGVELFCDSLGLQDLHLLWELLKPNVPLAITYVARAVPIDSSIALTDAPGVQTRVFEMSGVSR